jgi:hypothetical protein
MKTPFLEPVRKQSYQCLFSYRLLWLVRTHTMEPLFMNRALVGEHVYLRALERADWKPAKRGA